MQSSRLALFAFSLVGAYSVQAAAVTFFGEDLNGNPLSRISFPNATAARTSFLTALSGSTSTDTLEELTAGTLAPITLTFSGISTTTLTAGNSAVRSLASGTDGFGEFPTSGNNYIASDPNATFVITFSSPITSFGFYGSDFGDSASAHLTVVFSGLTPPVTENVNDTLSAGRQTPADGSVLFFGYINTAAPFTTVQITSPGNTSPNETFGFDDPVIGIAAGSAIAPEPSAWFLLAAGLLALSPKILKEIRLRN